MRKKKPLTRLEVIDLMSAISAFVRTTQLSCKEFAFTGKGDAKTGLLFIYGYTQ